jgi:hypothetical protein
MPQAEKQPGEMSGWAQIDSAIQQLRNLPPDRQALVLKGIPVIKQRAIMARMNDVAPEKGKPEESSMQGDIQRNALMMGKKAQEFQGKAQDPNVWQGGKVTGQRPLLVRAGNTLMAFAADTSEVINKAYAGALDWKTAAAMVVSKLSPAAAGAFFATQGGKAAYEAIKNGQATPENVQNFLLGLATVAGGVAGAAEGAPAEAARITKAPELVRRGGQILAGVGAERTTRPMVEEYTKAKAEAEKAQAEENTKADESNRGKVEKHATAKREAFQAEEEAKAEHAHETEQVKARNDAQQDVQSRRGVVAREINRGSEELGNSVKELEGKVRQQGNELYDTVKAKVANDPGVDTEVVADSVRHAKTQILKGSPESIKQFNAIESREVLGTDMKPGEGEDAEALGAWENLENEANKGDKLKFDQLQGFSSEIGTKLAKGNLPGDVYQALKHVKETIDQQKAVIANRNGAGAQLKAADSFWRGYMETFYDKPSAVAATLARVGKLDSQFYAEPFLKGKSAGLGIKALEKYDPELATKVQELRDKNEEFKKLPAKAKTEALPEPPKPGEPPARPELKGPKKIEQPKAPTEEDVIARKKETITKSARRLGELNRFDVGLMSGVAAAALGELLRGDFANAAETAGGGAAVVAGRKAFGEFIQRPKVQEWLAKPTAKDIEILKQANPEAQSTLKNQISEYIKTAIAHGQKVPVAPEMKSWLGEVGRGLVKRGKEILKSDEGSATVPGTSGGEFDWSKTSSVGGGEADAFSAAKAELYPGKRELTTAQTSEVSRRATEMTQERKAAAGARQGKGETHPGHPGGWSPERGEGESDFESHLRGAEPSQRLPALRRAVKSLRARYEAEAARGDDQRFETRLELGRVEEQLADLEEKEGK